MPIPHAHHEETLDDTVRRVRAYIDEVLSSAAPEDLLVRVDLDELERKLSMPKPRAKHVSPTGWRA